MTATRRRRPLARLAGTIARLPRYLNLAQRLLRDKTISPSRKAALGLGMGYVALPFDLIPGIIPVLGQLDDLAALLLGLRTALHGCSPESADAHLTAVGLSRSALDADVRTVQVAGIWLITGAAKLGLRAAALPFRALRRAKPTAPQSAAHRS